MKKIFMLILILFYLFIPQYGTLAAENNINKTIVANNKSIPQYSKSVMINIEWWKRFNDPILLDYIIKTADNNHDLKIASLKVKEFQTIVQQQFGNELPSLSINPQFNRLRLPSNMVSPKGAFDIPILSQNLIAIPLSTNYELDLWRKNRVATIAKIKELDAVKYDEKATYISLTTNVATVYFNILNIDKLIEIQKKLIEIKTKRLEIIKSNHEYGLNTDIIVNQVEKSLIEAKSSVNQHEKNQTILLNQIAVLTGASLDNVLSLKRSQIDAVNLINNLPATIQSDIVLARPDILKAEAQLQKAKIDVDLARKDFLPSISISGQYGYNAYSLEKLFDWNSALIKGTGTIMQSLYSGGQKRARLKGAKYRYQQILENYQKTILQSFQEVNDSLFTLKSDLEENKNNIDRFEIENKNLIIDNDRYNAGIISFLDTLSTKEKVYLTEMEQIQTKTNCLVDSLSLYKSAGGNL